MLTNRSNPPGVIVPSLIYADIDAAVRRLCDVFGFRERLRVGPPGEAGHAQLLVGEGGSVILGKPRIGQGFATPDMAAFRPPRADEVSITLTVRVNDVDAHHEHAKARGARILNPPTTYPFGERQYTAEDLAGYRWNFSQTVAEVDPTEWGATVAS